VDRRQKENLAVHRQPGNGSDRHHDTTGLSHVFVCNINNFIEHHFDALMLVTKAANPGGQQFIRNILAL
jgi:hypothetical protein